MASRGWRITGKAWAVLVVLLLAAGPGWVTIADKKPGESFETAGLLGLTGDLNQGDSGIELRTNDDLGYYFYLKLGAETNLTFTFYTEQPVGDYQSRVKNKIVLMTLYDANKASRAVSTHRCTVMSGSQAKSCTATLNGKLKGNLGYYLFVNFHTYDDRSEGTLDSKSYSGWLTWAESAVKVAARGETLGQTSKNALNWVHKTSLHGQIDADQKEHWYRMVLPSKATIELSAWGEKDSNLDLTLYRPGQVDTPLGSNVAPGDQYPTMVTFTVPSGSDRAEVLLKISNPGKSNTEYTVSYIKK